MYSKTTWASYVSGGTPLNKTNLDHLETQYTNIVAIGEIKMYAGATAPTNFLMCDGSSYNGTAGSTWAALYAVISSKFGGSGGSTFQVPNLKGKFVAGYSGAGEYLSVGLTGGTSDVTLTSTELPPHAHSFDAYYASGLGYYYGISYYFTDCVFAPNSSYYTDLAGGGGAHNNVPQYVTVNYIIRYQ